LTTVIGKDKKDELIYYQNEMKVSKDLFNILPNNLIVSNSTMKKEKKQNISFLQSTLTILNDSRFVV
jgi:hypothetical protein